MSLNKQKLKTKCPTCKKEIIYDLKNPWRPFCSQRCKEIDLGSWASEDFKIPQIEEENLKEN